MMIDAYGTRNDHNLIILNWQEAGGNYLEEAVPNAISASSLFQSPLNSQKPFLEQL